LFKVEIALVRGKREYEKKQKLKERDVQREMDRDVQRFRNKK
jgi:tmRNA-binding protein